MSLTRNLAHMVRKATLDASTRPVMLSSTLWLGMPPSLGGPGAQQPGAPQIACGIRKVGADLTWLPIMSGWSVSRVL